MNNLVLKACVFGQVRFDNMCRFFKEDERGVTAVEYAIVLAGVAAVVAVIFGRGGTVDGMLGSIFNKVQSTVNNSMVSGSTGS